MLPVMPIFDARMNPALVREGQRPGYLRDHLRDAPGAFIR